MVDARRTGLALSVQQPWAFLIVHGLKSVENRSWRLPAKFVGCRVGIHAGKKFDADGYAWVQLHLPALGMTPADLPPPSAFPRGGIVGAVTLAGCVTESASPWFFGPFGFVVEDPEPLVLIECPGRLGFFRPEVARP